MKIIENSAKLKKNWKNKKKSEKYTRKLGKIEVRPKKEEEKSPHLILVKKLGKILKIRKNIP